MLQAGSWAADVHEQGGDTVGSEHLREHRQHPLVEDGGCRRAGLISNDLIDHGEQLRPVHGLGDMGIHAGFATPPDLLGQGIGRQGNDG